MNLFPGLPRFPDMDEDDYEKDERFMAWLREVYPDDPPFPYPTDGDDTLALCQGCGEPIVGKGYYCDTCLSTGDID